MSNICLSVNIKIIVDKISYLCLLGTYFYNLTEKIYNIKKYKSNFKYNNLNNKFFKTIKYFKREISSIDCQAEIICLCYRKILLKFLMKKKNKKLISQ